MPSKRVYEIDLFRFLAAISVMLFHYTVNFTDYGPNSLADFPYFLAKPVTKYGYLGVDLFFIVSGFVIFMSASSGSAKHFVISRIVRLYPAFWVCCTITFVAMLLMGGTRFVATFNQYLVNMTMLSGFLRVDLIDPAYWSLFEEMKLYFLVFLVLLFGQFHRAKELLGIWLLLVLIVSQWPVPYASFLLAVDYAPYFIGGATFFLIYRDGLCLYKGFLVATSYLAAAAHVIKMIGIREVWYRTSYSDVITASIVAVFFGVFFLLATGRTKSISTNKWMLLGALTYPLYLIHQVVGYILFKKLYGYVNNHVLMWGVVALMLGVAYLIHQKIERVYAKPMKAALGKALTFWAEPKKGHAEAPPISRTPT